MTHSPYGATPRISGRATAVGLVLACPVAIGAAYSLLAAIGLAGPGAAGLTLAPSIAVLESADTWRSLGWTFATAVVATSLAFGLACGTATWFSTRAWWQRLAFVPMAVPHVAAALAALLLFSQSGLASRLALASGLTQGPSDFPVLVYDRFGVALILAFAWKEFPYLLMIAVAVLSAAPRDMADVARTLGASPRQAFWRITWPTLWRGTAPAVIATIAFLVGQYEMPALLAPSDPLALPLLTFERSVDPALTRRAEAHVLSLLALTLAAVLIAAHAFSAHRLERRA
ncbi:MAG: ABC transporter permease subunit [Vicinamibacterales bacterium]